MADEKSAEQLMKQMKAAYCQAAGQAYAPDIGIAAALRVAAEAMLQFTTMDELRADSGTLVHQAYINAFLESRRNRLLAPKPTIKPVPPSPCASRREQALPPHA